MREWLRVFYAMLKDVVAHWTCTQWLSAWNMSGLSCSFRMRACPPISHPRRRLCNLAWHACVHVRWVTGQEYTVRASHPNLLCAFLIHELRVVVFLSLQSLSLFFWKQIANCKKRKDHCEMATDCSFSKKSPAENAIIIMEERTKTIQHVNQIKH